MRHVKTIQRDCLAFTFCQLTLNFVQAVKDKCTETHATKWFENQFKKVNYFLNTESFEV